MNLLSWQPNISILVVFMKHVVYLFLQEINDSQQNKTWNDESQKEHLHELLRLSYEVLSMSVPPEAPWREIHMDEVKIMVQESGNMYGAINQASFEGGTKSQLRILSMRTCAWTSSQKVVLNLTSWYERRQIFEEAYITAKKGTVLSMLSHKIELSTAPKSNRFIIMRHEGKSIIGLMIWFDS